MPKQKKSSMLMRRGSLPGFTFVEVLLVLMLIAILSVASLVGFVNSQRSFVFNGAVQQVVSLAREARSLAVSGKALLDYSDYDQDGLDDEDDDYVTPAHYGVFFDDTAGSSTLTLFADLHGSTEGQYDPPSTPPGEYDPGNDMILAVYTIPPNLTLILNPSGTDTIMYTPVFADTLLESALGPGEIFFVFGLQEQTGPALNAQCFAVHLAAGVPETANAAGALDQCTAS